MTGFVCHRLRMAMRSLENALTGNVSRTALLSGWLPLSVMSCFGTLIASALFFPTEYNWRVVVISKLTSPEDNPRGYWLASLGLAAAILLATPFAGYVAQRLHAITPRLARLVGLAFALSFGLMVLAVAAQLAEPVIGLPKLHRLLAAAAAQIFLVGMVCCCASAVRDRSAYCGGQKALPRGVAIYWLSISLLPAACAVGIGMLVLLGQHGEVVWAENFRQSFRHTVFWRLAFWEWVGIAAGFAVLLGSVWFLPAACGERKRILPDSDMDNEQDRLTCHSPLDTP